MSQPIYSIPQQRNTSSYWTRYNASSSSYYCQKSKTGLFA